MKNLQMWVRYQWDRAAAIVAVVIGALALLLGWIGASGTPHPAEQIPYVISGGLFGIFLLGLGVMLWLSADLRDNWRKLNEMQGRQAADETEPDISAYDERTEALQTSASSNGRARRRAPATRRAAAERGR